MAARVDVRIQSADFDASAEADCLTAGLPDVGAIVTFTGVCRADRERLAALELEHYPGMAEAEIGRICTEAAARWPVQALCAIHRVGVIRPGENIVLVIAASSHRQAAFDAAGFVMDFLKSRAPFWKKEHLSTGQQGDWVDAKESDEDALKRWE
ncbi:MAG: molybdenum cofactor biosynthesis protein MoaE [Mesorhizobium sp.]